MAEKIIIENNNHIIDLVGPDNQFLEHMANLLNVDFSLKGNEILLKGENASIAKKVINNLHDAILKGMEINIEIIDSFIRMKNLTETIKIATKKKTIYPRSEGQIPYINAMIENDLIFATGPAGTGKTYLAVAVAVSLLLQGKIDRIILARPAVEAGERLGFLPGDLREKVDPYLRPIYDALYEMLPFDQVESKIENGEIEIAALAYMRGRTLSNSFVILDEAQNATFTQLKMFVTRLGYGSKMVITGDLTQIDLPNGNSSGLLSTVKIMQNVSDVKILNLGANDVVRHPLVAKIVNAYTDYEKILSWFS